MHEVRVTGIMLGGTWGLTRLQYWLGRQLSRPHWNEAAGGAVPTWSSLQDLHPASNRAATSQRFMGSVDFDFEVVVLQDQPHVAARVIGEGVERRVLQVA